MEKAKASLSVIIAAAGRSQRFQSSVRKPFVPLRRKPILYYSLETYASLEETSQIIVAVNSEDLPMAIKRLKPRARKCKLSAIIEGGKQRFDTVALALMAVNPQAEFIAVHDAARPFVSPKLIRSVLKAAMEVGAAVPALEMSDTIKTATKDGRVDVTLDRSNLRAIQTPQIFRRDWFIAAYEKYAGNHFQATDDSQVLEVAGYPVAIVAGEKTNLKITHPEDMIIAKAIAEQRHKPACKKGSKK